MPKYNNLKELAEAFKSGELSRGDWILRLDNDNSSLYWRGEIPFPEDSDAHTDFFDAKHDEAYEWFRGNGYADLQDACEAAGIPAEWV